LADVVMPQLGETVTEGTVTRWLKSVGETVARDEPLFEVSTDKVDSEVPSPADGVLSEIVVPEGETVDVGTVLAVLSDQAAAPDGGGATRPSAAAAPAAAVQPPPASQPPSEPPPAGAVAAPAPAPAEPPPPVPPAPAPPAAATEAPPAPASAPPDGRGAGARSAQVSEPGLGATPDGRSGGADRVLSPVVRRLLDEHGLDPAGVPGTGPGGRITRADVLNLIDSTHEAGAVPARAGTPASASPSQRSATTTLAPPGARAGTDEVIPFTNIRRRTAEHMVRSKATSAHTLVVLEADYEQVERVRRSHGRRFKEEEGFSLTYLPFVVRATVEALHEWPNLNSSVGEDSLIVHHQFNIGVAVDLDHQGLIVPVVKNAEELTLRGVARKIRDLADRARTKRLSADDISGGTFSLTNAGPFGTLLTAPVINQPQVAILSTDAVKRRPVVITQPDGDEAIAIHSIGLLCLSWDHRAVDGAYAAQFLARVVDLLSSHDWSTEL
jgi:pyruvate dehydrogenase E2 component (dihydrolipoamide acetyltransferase)